MATWQSEEREAAAGAGHHYKFPALRRLPVGRHLTCWVSSRHALSPRVPRNPLPTCSSWAPPSSKGALGERLFPVPHRTPAPTPGNQSRQEPCFLQLRHPPPEPARLPRSRPPGPFTELPGTSSKSPCPGPPSPRRRRFSALLAAARQSRGPAWKVFTGLYIAHQLVQRH